MVAHITKARVADTSTTTGTSDFTVSGSPPTGYRTINDVCATNDTFYYCISHQTASEWEEGIGTYSGSNVFVRTTVLDSSNSGGAVNFSAGTKDVFITRPALGSAKPARVHTAAGAVTVAVTDDIIIVNKASGAATTVNLPSSPIVGQRYEIKDGKGDAATNNITITPASGNIDGSSTFVMDKNYQSVIVAYNGTQWNKLANSRATLGLGSSDSPQFAGINDDSNNEFIKFSKTASAVNEVTLTNAATGNPPQIAATGGDSNIDLNVVSKGTGVVKHNGFAALSLNAGVEYLRGFLGGLGLTYNSTTTIDVAAGSCADATAAMLMKTGAVTINCATTGALGLDATDSSLANNTWYHVYVIGKTDGTVSAMASTNASAPATYPSGYTLRRRIGSFRTNGSAQITSFTQTGDDFLWASSVHENGASNISVSTSRVTQTLSGVPTGLKVRAKLYGYVFDSGSGQNVWIGDLAETDAAPNASAAPGAYLYTGIAVGGTIGLGDLRPMTNTSAQIGMRSTGAVTFRLFTKGWIDTRGRDA